MMKKTCMALCLFLLVSMFTFPVFASDEILYREYITGSELGENVAVGKYGFDGSRKANAIADYTVNTEEGYITVYPKDTFETETRWLSKTFTGLSGANTPIRPVYFSLEFTPYEDYTSNAEDCFLRLKMKSTVVPSLLWVASRRDKVNGGNKEIYIPKWKAEDENNENWFTIDIPLTNLMLSNQFTNDKRINAVSLEFMYTDKYLNHYEPAPIDIADVSVWGPDVRAAALQESSKMNSEGLYEVNLAFDNDLADSTVAAEAFTVNGLAAQSASYNSAEKTVSLAFDMMPEFPSELVLNISDDVKGANGFSVKPEVKITNAPVTELAAIDVGNTTCVLNESVINLKVKVNSIYNSNDISVFVAVTDGDKLVACGMSEKKNIAYKASDVFDVNIPDITPSANLKAEIFVIDDAAIRRPMATNAFVIPAKGN